MASPIPSEPRESSPSARRSSRSIGGHRLAGLAARAALPWLLLAACGSGERSADRTPDPPAERPRRHADHRLFRPGPVLETFVPPKAPGSPRTVRGAEAVAIFDVDVDGRLDVVLVNGENRIHTFLAAHDGRPGAAFTLHETPVGPDDDGHVYDPKGLAVHDWDGDGALDLWVGNQGPGEPVTYHAEERLLPDAGRLRSAAYATRRNARDGTFPPLDVGLVGAGGQRALIVADLDRDGHADAFRSNSAYYGPYYAGGTEGNALQPGLADGRFGPDVIASTLAGGPADFWTNAAGEAEKNFKGVVVRDLDHDGRPELVLGAFADVWANYRAETITGGPGWQGPWARGVFLLHNVSDPGRLRFREVAHEAIGPWAWDHGTAGPVHAVLTLDLDGDADLDLLLTGYKGLNGHGTIEHDTALVRVLRNDSEPGRLGFTDVTEASGLARFNRTEQLPPPYPLDVVRHGVAMRLWPAMLEGAAADLDLDGDPDVVLADRQIVRTDGDGDKLRLHAWVFLNDGRGRFEIVPLERHGLKGTSRALSVGDLDADGRPDLVLVDGSGGGQAVTDTNRVWWNDVDTTGGWASVEVSVPGDPWGMGTRVTVRGEDGRVLAHDEVRTDICYRSRRDATVLVGTADARRIAVGLVLPDGRDVDCPPVTPGRRLRVDVDGQGTAWLRSRAADAPRTDDRPLVHCRVGGPDVAGR
jgi:hypothetical protein